MRTILSILAILVLLTGFAASAFAQADAESVARELLADCDYVEYAGMVSSTEDTLHFGSAAAYTGSANYDAAAPMVDWTTANADWFPPKPVPIGVDSNGDLIKQTRPVKRMVLMGVNAFGARSFQNGSATSRAGDLYMNPEAAGSGEFWYAVDNPDSAMIAEVAAADSTDIWLGY